MGQKVSEEYTNKELSAPSPIDQPLPPNAFDAARLGAVGRKQLRGLIERMIERGLFFTGSLILVLSIVGFPHRAEANRSILLCAWSIAILYLGNWVLSPITELKSLLWEASSNKEREDSIYFQYCGFRETLKGFFLCGAIVSALVVVTHFC